MVVHGKVTAAGFIGSRRDIFRGILRPLRGARSKKPAKRRHAP